MAMLGAVIVGVSIAQLFLGSAIAVVVLFALAVAVAVWIAPWTGIMILGIAAALIEQFPLLAEGANSDVTDRILFFKSLNAAAGLGGIYATPFELFLALLIAVWLIKGFATRTLALPRSPLSRSVAVFGLLIAIGWVRGVTGGGSFNDSLLELRPWLYLVIAYFVSSQLLTSKKHLQALLWVLAIGIGIKGIQGVISLALHYNARPQAILAHEESFFFGLFIAVLAALWLMPIKGRLRTTMTFLFPFVLVADIANQRRTAWAITGAALLAVFILCYVGLPERRRAIASFAAVGCVLAAIYWVGFSNNPGLMGQPARAVLSQLAPSSRDQQSNQYRTVENVNLGVAIRQTMPFGSGFGHPIPQQVPNVDVSNVDSFITYLPHNGVLYVWLRLGLAGIVCFWLLIGIAIMTAIQTFRRRRSEFAMLVSITLVLALVAYVMQGFFDMGLYWFRIAIAVGLLMGALEAVRRFEQDPAPTSDPVLTSHAPGRSVAVAKRHAA
jgi:O-Antigen ligase